MGGGNRKRFRRRRGARRVVEEDFELVSLYLGISNKVNELSETNLERLRTNLEHISEQDNDLGSFFSFYMTLVAENKEEIHQDIQDLLDVSGLNKKMLFTLGGRVELIVNDHNDI
jgi:hypothetical protein